MHVTTSNLNTARSEALFAQAQELIPGGVNSPVRAFRAVGRAPVFIERAEGPYLYDVDGNRYIDYVGSFGPLIMGHAHPAIVAAIQRAAACGTSYGAPTALEVELARAIHTAMPAVEMVRLVNSGTEATMSALRLARAFTGREIIVKVEGGYHGHADGLLARAGSGPLTLGAPDSPGVPAAAAARTINVPFNDSAALEQVLSTHPVAAFIVEPVPANMGVVRPRARYLRRARELTHRHGALLIFDEVITGFRLLYGGGQAVYRVDPDLTCLGKIIVGGLPVGAYGGRTDIMQLVAPVGPMYQAGTLSGNPLAVSAGLAMLELLRRPDAYTRLNQLAARLATGLRAGATRHNVPLRVQRVGSLLTAFFTDRLIQRYDDVRASDTARYARFFNAMLERGIYLAPSQFEAMFVSLAHTEEHIDATIAAAGEALAAAL
ncbi:MAG TPA: glutamate-1-semialdehyde 2,1-aminomutase [Chloroflexota bacterium]|nr:glutamate-1-semialdehyde 2,1-aminomutase [Chloroflexota bacterium]